MVDYLWSFTKQHNRVAGEHLLWVARTLPQQRARPEPEIYKMPLILKGRIAYFLTTLHQLKLKRLGRLWGPPSLLHQRYRDSFPGSKAAVA